MLSVRTRQSAFQHHASHHFLVPSYAISLPGDLILQCNLQDLFLAHAGKTSNCANGTSIPSLLFTVNQGRQESAFSYRGPWSDRLAVYRKPSLLVDVCYDHFVISGESSRLQSCVEVRMQAE